MVERILHYVEHALPAQSGYALRTAAIAAAQRRRGLEVAVATWQCRDAPRVGTGPRVERDGVVYLHAPERRRFFRLRAYAEWMEAQVGQPDIVHCHSPGRLCPDAAYLARRFGARLAYEVRGFWGGNVRAERRAALRADHAVAISRGIREALGLCDVSIVPNGVDVHRFHPATGPMPDAPIFGCATNVRELEGLQIAARAWPAVQRQVPGAGFRLFGDGDYLDALKDAPFEFAGRVPHAAMPERLRELSVYVLPRISTLVTEAVTPLKPLEAMASGIPVLASDVGGLRELIRDGTTGCLFRTGDVDDLARACVALARDPGRREHLARAARAWVVAERDWDTVVKRYDEVYRA